MKEIDPQITNRAQQFEIWKNAPNPMLVYVKLERNDNKKVREGRNKYIEKIGTHLFSVRSDYIEGIKKIIENYPVDNKCDNKDVLKSIWCENLRILKK